MTPTQRRILERIRKQPGMPVWHYVSGSGEYSSMRSVRESRMIEEFRGGLWIMGTAPRTDAALVRATETE